MRSALTWRDMRKQYDGLWAAARDQLGEGPQQGAVFYFTNRERTRVVSKRPVGDLIGSE